MSDDPSITFVDRVKKLWAPPESASHTVLFRRNAAFYSVESSNRAALEALTRSAETGKPVKVTSHGVSMRIIEASIEEA
ncbi:MAG: hypothetical protein RDV48_10980 [Candidatus Eremiobacteraeota bacterium]|nr:hypothetical protein [Candidatus Eremiobacteraeota bacterium]